jgi:hypothetical protein
MGWTGVADVDKAKHYERWCSEPAIGGVLSNFMRSEGVRVYIKDTLMKGYERNRLSMADRRVWLAVGLDSPPEILERYIKPHGVRLLDQRIICWGRARDWKDLLMANFERASLGRGARSFAVVLFDASDGWAPEARGVVETAAERLGIERLAWRE